MTKYRVTVELETELEMGGLEEPLQSSNVPAIMATQYIENLFKKKGLVGFAEELNVTKIEKIGI